MFQIVNTYFEHISNEINSWLKTRKNVLKNTGKIILVIGLSFTSAFPEYSFGKIYEALCFKNGMIMWLFNYFMIVFKIYPLVIKQYKSDFEKDLQMFFGISLESVVSYIIENGTFKLDEVSRYFSISRNIVSEMIERIDEAEIFIRGKNNARVLDLTLNKSEIIRRLSEVKIEEEVEAEIEEEENDDGMFQY